MFNKLRTVIYKVADLEAAKAWYSKATGLEPYFDQPFYVGFNVNGFELGLDPDMTGVQAGNHTQSLWDVDDINIACEKLVAIGGTIIQPSTNVGGAIFVATIADPFGNHIGLIQGS